MMTAGRVWKRIVYATLIETLALENYYSHNSFHVSKMLYMKLHYETRDHLVHISYDDSY